MVNNLANFDTKLLEKAYKRKLAESGDSVDPGPSTSKTQWSHDDIDAAQQVLRLGDKQTLELNDENLVKKIGVDSGKGIQY